VPKIAFQEKKKQKSHKTRRAQTKIHELRETTRFGFFSVLVVYVSLKSRSLASKKPRRFDLVQAKHIGHPVLSFSRHSRKMGLCH
jgi:hypothetical protein